MRSEPCICVCALWWSHGCHPCGGSVAALPNGKSRTSVVCCCGTSSNLKEEMLLIIVTISF